MRPIHKIPLAALLVVGFCATLHGQAGSLDDLRSRVMPGDTLTVQTTTTPRLKGRLQEISGSQLILSSNGTLHTLQENQIREIRKQQKDSVINGILIGMGAGMVTGLLAPGAFCGGFGDSECGTIVRVVFVPIGAGAGAAAGAIIDAVIKKQELVYVSPRSPAGFNFRFRF